MTGLLNQERIDIGQTALEVPHMIVAYSPAKESQGTAAMRSFLAGELGQVFEDDGESSLRYGGLSVGELERIPESVASVKLVNLLYISRISLQRRGLLEIGKEEDGHGLQLSLLVLHTSTQFRDIIHLLHLRAFLHEHVVVLQVLVIQAACLLRLLGARHTLDTCLHDLELIAFRSVAVSQLAAYLCPKQVTLPELRVFRQQLGEVAQGGMIIPGVAQQDNPVVEGYVVVGLPLQDVVEVFQGTVVFPDLGQQQSAVEMPHETAGTDGQGGIIVAQGSTQVITVVAEQRAVEEERIVTRTLHDGLVQVTLSLVIHLAAHQHHGLETEGIAVEGIDLQCLVHPMFSRQRVEFGQFHLRTHIVVLGLAWPFGYHEVQAGISTLVGFLFHLAEHQVMPAVGIHVIDFQSLSVVRLSLGKTVQMDAAESPQLIVVLHVRIAVNSVSCIRLSPSIVFQIELSQSTEEIRFSQMGFSPYDHIESLNTEHIILVEQRIASHEQNTFYVELTVRCQAPEACHYDDYDM